ncbi:predicted protein [Aspergillus terreus NIH2624]|uniref:MARVEL domain-containing protein n=1 Tax=Aspergillus terreus (strain NIH 2624 / FGSC A1156) TaxID=341663 RepID=Q0CT31_ASPTN|nr:uncharacterized protein ATEG_03153 [Aspergillus terreus NIH2624]EAU36427.1 predicted protein [Aspergillus terreus NIH2624]KAG2418222.1 hypothetical protein HFD88_001323 [Aspergillus terreus]
MHISRNWRNHNLFYILMAIELPVTIVILTFTGIASHDLYRTKLWQDGADNGFNSAPDELVYAAANYRSYHVPMVWSSFITNFNLVISVVSVFFLIVKAPVHVLRIWYPILSVIVHAGLVAIYIVSARGQAGSDMSDPQHPQPGPPWYITKSCSVAKFPSNVSYCRQAKALFAFTIIILVLYFVEFVLSIYNCIPTDEDRALREERREEKRIMKEYEDMVLKSPTMIPMTPAMPPDAMQTPHGMPAMTPRTVAFNQLENGSTDLPLREHFSSPNPPRLPQQQLSTETSTTAEQPQPQMYFPPPPKKAVKK